MPVQSCDFLKKKLFKGNKLSPAPFVPYDVRNFLRRELITFRKTTRLSISTSQPKTSLLQAEVFYNLFVTAAYEIGLVIGMFHDFSTAKDRRNRCAVKVELKIKNHLVKLLNWRFPTILRTSTYQFWK